MCPQKQSDTTTTTATIATTTAIVPNLFGHQYRPHMTTRDETKTKANHRQHEGVKGEGGDATQLTIYHPLEVPGQYSASWYRNGNGRKQNFDKEK